MRKSGRLRWRAGLAFDGASGAGGRITLDGADDTPGLRPTEGLLLSLAACTGMDVASILAKKRQRLERYEVSVEGEQSDEHPRPFRRIDLTHEIDGAGVEVEAVRRSIELSATRYCPVNATLASGAVEIHHRYRVRNGEGEHVAEVAVTGPHGALSVAASRP